MPSWNWCAPTHGPPRRTLRGGASVTSRPCELGLRRRACNGIVSLVVVPGATPRRGSRFLLNTTTSVGRGLVLTVDCLDG